MLSLQSLPLFPLQTVLFPGGWLSLQVFEVRYLDMVKRCHQLGAPFGVVCLTEGSEVESAAQRARGPEAFHSLGTLAQIETLEPVRPGLLHLQCKGQQRFVITRSEKLKHGLWVADVTLMEPDRAAPMTEDLSHTASQLQQLLHSFEAQGGDPKRLPLRPPYHWGDPGWVANRWAELLPVPTETKQRLMALESPMLRLELVDDLLTQLRISDAR